MILFSGRNEAVSAVVGIILMVAITVAIAATVYVNLSAEQIEESNLILQVSPQGYVELYEHWEIQVWKSIKGTHIPGDNVTVIVEINNKTKSNTSTYYLYTDVNGYCEFSYNEPEIHKFTATAKGFKSDSYQPETKFLNPDNLNYLFTLFSPLGLFPIISILFSIFALKKNPNKMINNLFKTSIILNLGYVSVFVGGLIVTTLFRESRTFYGYPESISLVILNLFFWIGIGLILMLIIISLMLIYLTYIKK